LVTTAKGLLQHNLPLATRTRRSKQLRYSITSRRALAESGNLEAKRLGGLEDDGESEFRWLYPKGRERF
jgi:hypothetical protein